MAGVTAGELIAAAPFRRVVSVDAAGTVVSGLTNTQLRAAPVDVLGPVTNTQLRASAVPVSGPVTNTELRAAAVPVSLSAVPKLGSTSRVPVWASGQHVVTSATTAKTAAITGTEVLISLSTDAYINIGTQASVVATKGAGSMFLKAGGPYLFQITSGQGVAAIMDTTAGVMSVLPVA